MSFLVVLVSEVVGCRVDEVGFKYRMVRIHYVDEVVRVRAWERNETGIDEGAGVAPVVGVGVFYP